VDKFQELFGSRSSGPSGPFPESTGTVSILFNTRDVKNNKFNQINVKAIGIVSGKSAVTYKTLLEKFGSEVIISFKPTKVKKVNPSRTTQLLNIDLKESVFRDKDGNDITYHDSTISDARNKIFVSLLESYNTQIHAQIDDFGEEFEIQ
jgi:hypothetical protein